MEAAIEAFLKTAGNGEAKLLYSLYYEHHAAVREGENLPLDLAFNDTMLENVEKEWKKITATGDSSESLSSFMVFEDRQGMDNEDDEVDDGF